MAWSPWGSEFFFGGHRGPQEACNLANPLGPKRDGVCVLRGHNSGENNPLLMADESGDEEVDEEKLGPRWPWAGYKACTDDKGAPYTRGSTGNYAGFAKRSTTMRRSFTSGGLSPTM